MKRFSSIAAVLVLTACSGPAPEAVPLPVIEQQSSNTEVLLQAVSAVSEDVAWISGHGGTVVRTVDGGMTWEARRVPGADTLQFRDVHAVSTSVAYLLGAGPGDMSRIYKTVDSGNSWTLQWVNPEPDGFYDCFDFWDERTGVVFGDAVDGGLRIWRTTDGGSTWNRVEDLPPPAGTEGGFAASGTCMIAAGERFGWIGTGAGDTARVLMSGDRGETWTAVPVPIVSGTPASGITSLSFFDLERGAALGGNLAVADEFLPNVAVTEDGGRSWRPGNPVSFPGSVYGSAPVPETGAALVAVGPAGMSFSRDGGGSWTTLDTLSYWAVGFGGRRVGWAAGPEGRIARLDLAMTVNVQR